MSFISAGRPAPIDIDSCRRSYGVWTQIVSKSLRAGALCMASLVVATHVVRAHAASAVQIVALGDSLTAGLGLPVDGRLRAAAASRARRQRHRRRDRQCRRLRRHRLRRLGAARLVGAGGHRCRHRRARRQRHAARHQAGSHARGAGRDFAPPDASGTLRFYCAACARRPISAPTTAQAFRSASIPSLRPNTTSLLYPFFLDGVAADRDLLQPDGLHPNAAGVERHRRRGFCQKCRT